MMKQSLLILSLCCALLCGAALPAHSAQTNEAALIKILQSKTSNRDKSDACAKLKLIATGKSVSALATLLTNENLSHSARYVLESLPDPKAGKALRNALVGPHQPFPAFRQPQRLGVLSCAVTQTNARLSGLAQLDPNQPLVSVAKPPGTVLIRTPSPPN